MSEPDFAATLASDIHITEEALDTALGFVGGFFGRLVQARRDANLSTTIGHEVFESVNEGTDHIMKARRALITAHKKLEVISRRRGFDPDQTPINKPPQLANMEPMIALPALET